MKDSLLQLCQQRMDKCQSEQFWAVASFAAANAFVLSEAKTFTDGAGRTITLAGLALAGGATAAFVINRSIEYYKYRSDIVKLLNDDPTALDYLKKDTGASSSANSWIWFGTFFIAVALPFGAACLCLK